MARTAHPRGGERIAVEVGVVGLHARRADRQRRVLVHGVTVVVRDWRVVDAADGDRHRRHARVDLAVVGFVREAVGAVVVGRGHIREAAVGVERERAVGRPAHHARRERIAFGIGVVPEHARREHHHRGVLT